MKILHVFGCLLAAAFIMPVHDVNAQNYTNVYGAYNYKGNLKAGDTTFLKRLITGDCALDSSALAQFNSTCKGILVPRLTTGQMDSIKHPADGLLVYDITVGCFFYYDDTIWAGMGACASAWTAAGGGTVTNTTTVSYPESDTEQAGMIIGNSGVAKGIILLDSASTGVAFMGTGDFSNSIGTKNTAAMVGGNGNNSGGIAVQPDGAGGFKLVTVTQNGDQRISSTQDSSFYQMVSYDSTQYGVLDVLPGLVAVSETDSSNIENGIRAVNGGLDIEIGNNLISFNNFSYPLSHDMVFKTDDDNNGVIDYLHSTKDSFAIAGTLKVTDGTQGAGKVLTSDAGGNASWQNPTGGGWGLIGNGGTSSTTNYIGTSDSTGLTFKTNNTVFGYIDSLQMFNFNTDVDSEVMGIMTTNDVDGVGLKGIFVGDETAQFGFYQIDARGFGFSKHLILVGDTGNTHLIVDDSVVQLRGNKLVDVQSADQTYVQGINGVLLGGGAGVGMGGNYITMFDGDPSGYYNNVSDSSYVSGELMVGGSPIDSNNLSGGMAMGTNVILGDGSSITGNNLVGHGVINGLYPGMSENIISGNSHIDSNYIEGAVLVWNLGRLADNSSFSHNYLKNLSTEVNIQDVSGQFNENVVGDTVTGDNSGIWGVTLLGNDSIAFNTLSGTSSSIRNLVMMNSSINHCNLAIPNAGVITSQFYNSNITHVSNQVYSSTFFNVNKDFSTDSVPWNNIMLVNETLGVGITSRPTATLQIGDNTNAQSFRYVDGNQSAGKVLTSDANGNATWQPQMGGGGSAWGLYGASGTNTISNYIGTSDNNGLALKTNDVTFGYIDSLQMFSFSTTIDSDTYAIKTTNNIGGLGLNGMFTGDTTAQTGFYTCDARPFGFSKHLCVAGSLPNTHVLLDDSLLNIKSTGMVVLNGKQGIQLETDSGGVDISTQQINENAQLITAFNPTILTDSVNDSSSVNANTVVDGAIFGGNTLSGGAEINGNYLGEPRTSCTGNNLLGHGSINGFVPSFQFNELHDATHLDSNYLEGAAVMRDVGQHSDYSSFSHNFLRNLATSAQIYSISGGTFENVVYDSIVGDYSQIFDLTLMSFDSVAYNVLSGANTNINNLIMQNSDLNYCHFASPNTGFNFSQLFNSRIVNDTVNVVNCFFHNVNKDFKSETQSWSNIMLLNDNVGIGIVSKPVASLQVGDSASPQSFRYVDGNQASGKVLTSDGYGSATWQPAAGVNQSDSTGYFTPASGDTISVLPYKYNIVDSTGVLSAVTISLPPSPVEGEWVEVKFAQSGVLMYYLNGTVANSAPKYIDPSNLYIKLVFRAANSTWY